ncbi:MAG: hypothetical protein HDQ97_16870 [Lachnospiraceae bacterium]|nr:hypothetical protein [Lachnospiraceae bacterium]
MKLERLTQSNFYMLADKEIVCYEKSETYLRELYDEFDVKHKVKGIIDENRRNQGSFFFEGTKLTVMDAACIPQIDLKKTAFLITSDYFIEAYDKLSEMESLKDSVDIVYYFANKETKYELEYRKMYQDTSLENIILFRSGPHASSYVKGMDFADNARALFDYMLQNGYNEKYELVWLVKNPNEFGRYHDIKNVKFLSYEWSVSEKKEERDSYYHALCLSKFIFFTDAYGFARNCRKDQTRIQLWHGCGFKTRVNFVRCEKRYEYTTVISDVYSKIHQDIYGLREDQILVTGYAKQDWLFHPVTDWKEKLGIPKAQKHIFWLPTFRTAKEQLENLNEYELGNQTGLPVVDTHEMLARLDMLLKSLGAVLILKLHPFQDREKIGRIDMENIIMLDNGQLAEKDIQINQLLGHADALISDYSSAAVDYMILDRPIAFTLDDVEEYEQSRGFVFENIEEWLPGMGLLSFEDMCCFIKEVGEDIDTTKEKRRELIAKMHKYQDDNSCRRIVEALRI